MWFIHMTHIFGARASLNQEWTLLAEGRVRECSIERELNDILPQEKVTYVTMVELTL